MKTMTRLDEIAVAALKKHKGNVDKALPEFISAVKASRVIDDLARAFLQGVAVGQVAGRGEGHPIFETQRGDADPAPPSLPPVKGSIKVREYDVPPHRRRTQAEKEAATRAMMASAEAVFELQIEGRALGSIAIGELASLKHRLVDDASQKLMLGAEQVRNAVLAELLEQHCTVQDQLTRVRDAFSAKTTAELVERAEQIAPRRITAAMHRAAEAMEHREISA